MLKYAHSKLCHLGPLPDVLLKLLSFNLSSPHPAALSLKDPTFYSMLPFKGIQSTSSTDRASKPSYLIGTFAENVFGFQISMCYSCLLKEIKINKSLEGQAVNYPKPKPNPFTFAFLGFFCFPKKQKNLFHHKVTTIRTKEE